MSSFFSTLTKTQKIVGGIVGLGVIGAGGYYYATTYKQPVKTEVKKVDLPIAQPVSLDDKIPKKE